MSEHAKFSPSSASRYLACPRALLLEQQFKDQGSCYAEEGTVAHALAEYKLKRELGLNTEKPDSDYINDEMQLATDNYVIFAQEQISEAKRLCTDPVILIEQRVSVEAYAPDTFGTADLLIVADSRLTVVDLKYGKGVEVFADHNPQMMIYALGAYELLGNLYDIKQCRMIIFQPRLDHISVFDMALDDLVSWGENVLRPRAQQALNGEGEFLAGDHCRFCKARFTCRARADQFMKLAELDFRKPETLGNDEIPEILQKARQLGQWVDDVFSYAESQAINNGQHWQGFKLVRGRSTRRYVDDDQAAKRLIAAGYSNIYRQSLLGITDMERMLGKQKFTEILSGLVTKPEGKPTLVPETDRRDEIESLNSAQTDFMEE